MWSKCSHQPYGGNILRMSLDKFQMIANCYGGSNVLYMLILHSKCSINVPTSCVQPGTCRNIWNVPNLLSTRACNVLKMFSLVSGPPHPQCHTMHRVIRLKRSNQSMPINWIHSSTYHRLNICHWMIKAGPDDTDQLLTSVDHSGVWPLVVMSVPLLHASLHLSHVVGSHGQTLKTTTSGHRTRRDEVVQGQIIKGTEHTPWTLHGLIDHLSQRIGTIWIIMGSPSILDVVAALEPLEALHPSLVDILGVATVGIRFPLASPGTWHWGWGGLETNKNILSTLQALVESTCHLPADNRLGTFQMFL